jgi:hypothetical protein
MNENRNQNRNEFDRSDKHLTANEISRWLVEGPESSASRHLQSCGACRATLAEAQEPLTVFRTALVGWSEAQSGAQSLSARNLEKPKEKHWGIRLWLPVSSLALAALLLAGYSKLPGTLRGHSPDQTAATLAHPTPESDAALLDQVDVEVSEAVPDSMAPLTDLVAWDSSNGSEAISAEKPVMHKKTSASAKSTPAAEIAN